MNWSLVYAAAWWIVMVVIFIILPTVGGLRHIERSGRRRPK